MAINDKSETAANANDAACLVYATIPSRDLAEAMARALVVSRLAACVNVIPHMTAIYEWQGAVQSDSEAIALIKTTRLRTADVIAAIRQSHPFDNPAIVVLPIVDGSTAFLQWIADQTTRKVEHAGEA